MQDSPKSVDTAVIGGGIVGSAIAYGLASLGSRVVLIDGGDRDFRAANANFGLIWLQGKGMNMPEYQQWTRDSVRQWAEFSDELSDITAVDLQYEQNGGLTICLGEDELEQRRSTLLRLHNQFGNRDPDFEMINRDELAKLLPRAAFGSDVTGASFGRSDGCANPLRLLAALQAASIRKGGAIMGGSIARTIERDGPSAYSISVGGTRVLTEKIVIAAGLGTKDLAAQVDLDIPMRPQRGQILVTERMEPFLPLPTSGLRQTKEGTVMIGATQDEAGFDVSTTSAAAAALSSKAIRRISSIRQATLVRQWAGLRILTPDRHPIYSESETHPGVFVAACHSGVTLAAIHSTKIASAIAIGKLPAELEVFHHRRFDVPKAA